MANVMVNDLKQHIKGLRLYRKYIRVIGEEETLVEDRNDTLSEIVETVERISKANALIAWLREAVKERENALEDINAKTIQYYAMITGYEMTERPTMPQEPRVNFNDLNTVLDAGLTVKEYNRALELNSTLAVLGEFIHEKGLLTMTKATLQRIEKNPVEVKESGRDTIITRYEADKPEMVDGIYTELQAKYRKLQAEKNGLDNKWSNQAAEYQVRKHAEYQDALAAWKTECAEWDAQYQELKDKWMIWKKQECDRIAALKIIIPNDLANLYTELRDKYM
jgi:uncharacterized protein YlxW (UPF0749 family)